MQKDEIKEILYYWEKYHFDDCMIDSKECKLLYDYITNLEQENKVLRENAMHNDKVVDQARWNEMLYKSKIDKAIHRIHNLKQQVQSFGQEIPCWIDELENDLGGDE